jgi:hypothetical protein
MSIQWPPEKCWMCEVKTARTPEGVCNECFRGFSAHIDPEGNDRDYDMSGVQLAEAALRLVASHVKSTRSLAQTIRELNSRE